jgi:DNA-binding NarL/FixJ family response regulator
MPASDRQGTWITDEERSVLAASATGLGITEVAELLGLPPEAVRRSIASAMRTLGARSKLEAIIVAFRHGLIRL